LEDIGPDGRITSKWGLKETGCDGVNRSEGSKDSDSTVWDQ